LGADGAAEGLAHVVLDGLLDGERDAAGVGRLAFAADELADHLVDGRRVGDGADALDRGGDAVGKIGVDGVVAGDEADGGAEGAGFGHLGAGLDAEGFGLVAGGDEGAGVGHGGGNAGGFAAEFRVQLLLDRGEEAVEVDVQEGEEVGLSGGAHWYIIFALHSLFALLLVLSMLLGNRRRETPANA
jgi:hypothetical protein